MRSLCRLPLSRIGWLRLRCFSVKVNAMLEKDLDMIPEFKEAKQLVSRHQHALAVPLLLRARMITKSALASNPSYEFITAQKLSQAHRYLGEFQLAEDTINSAPQSGLQQVIALRTVAACRLLRGNVGQAVEAAQAAVHICEDDSFDKHADLVDVMYPSYSMLGLCSMYAGDADAETYLQLAARWSAGDAAAALVSYSNLGAHLWITAERDSLSSGKITSSSVILGDIAGYYEEALKDTSVGQESSASGMCGPSGGVSGGVSGDRMLDMIEAKHVQGSTSVPIAEMPSKVNTPPSVDAQIASITLHLNLHDLYLAQENKSKAASIMASAMTQLTELQTQFKQQPEMESLSTLSLTTNYSAVMGKALCQVATAQLHAANAVTAEGLFRSALAHLQGSQAPHNPLVHYQLSATLNEYAKLLDKWEKREFEAVPLRAHSDSLMKSVPKFTSRQHTLTPHILLPC